MVAPDSEWFTWLFSNEENSLLTMRTLEDVVAKLDALVRDPELRHRLSDNALATIAANHSDWDGALAGVHAYMSDPGPSTTPDLPAETTLLL